MGGIYIGIILIFYIVETNWHYSFQNTYVHIIVIAINGFKSSDTNQLISLDIAIHDKNSIFISNDFNF